MASSNAIYSAVSDITSGLLTVWLFFWSIPDDVIIFPWLWPPV